MDNFPNGAGYHDYEDVPRDLESFHPEFEDNEQTVEELEDELETIEEIRKDYQ